MLGLTPKETLEALQSLYEKHKAVSYPRTQCRYVSTERTKEFPVLLRSVSVFPELADALPEADLKRARNKRVVNDSEVSKESHDALLPTSQLPDLSKMTEREKTSPEARLYEIPGTVPSSTRGEKDRIRDPAWRLPFPGRR